MSKKETDEEKKSVVVDLPSSIVEKLEEEKEDIDQYVANLIERDYNTDSSPHKKGEGSENELSGELKKRAKLEFLKEFRDDEWIEYMDETRGEEALINEADRLIFNHEEKWTKFSKNFDCRHKTN